MYRPAIRCAFILCCVALVATLATGQTNTSKTTVRYPSAVANSPRLADLPMEDAFFAAPMEEPRPLPLPMMSRGPLNNLQGDAVVQSEAGPQVAAVKGIDFDGVGAQGFAPSDVNLAVGPNHIVQTVNVRLVVYSKSGTLLSGPTNFTTFFSALAGDCKAGASDPIVNYDRLADRWVISDIGIGTHYSECVAVSKTNDPTGAYTLYAYSFGTTLNDYPKVGVWPTTSNAAYLATYNLFGAGFLGADLCGFDRTKMLLGDPTAAQLCQKTPNTEGGYLPADLDGLTPPADGTPGLFITWQNNNPGQLYLRKLTLNFGTSSTSLSAPVKINVANTSLACGSGGTCVPQKGTSQTLDTLGDRLMYRMAYRKFADHERVVINHSVGNGGQVAVRWYELLDVSSGTPVVNQQGTYAPDATYRWMASAAMDKANDIAIGYSASSSTLNPAIRFTGRVPTDAPGTLSTEDSILEGSGSQTNGLSRWGDYTALQVDPADDCTFWYTNQYQKINGTFDWSTRIGSFAFPNCTGGGGGGPAVTLVPTSLKWAKFAVGTLSATKNVTLTNTGTQTLNISSITTTGDFLLKTVKKSCGSTVAAGASCLIKVQFAPTQVGVRNGTVKIVDNAPDSPQTVALSGTGK